MVSNECYNACKEKDLEYGMTETDSVQVGLELNAFSSLSSSFYFKSDFRYKTRENTVNTGPPGRSTLKKKRLLKGSCQKRCVQVAKHWPLHQLHHAGPIVKQRTIYCICFCRAVCALDTLCLGLGQHLKSHAGERDAKHYRHFVTWTMVCESAKGR